MNKTALAIIIGVVIIGGAFLLANPSSPKE
jgi:hypothetical protein